MKCDKCGREIKTPLYQSIRLVEEIPGIAYSRQEVNYCHKCGERHEDDIFEGRVK